MTAEQEELVAKMLASGMDEATAYQYLQQLCGAGVAGKGSKPKLILFYLFPHSPQNAINYIPALSNIPVPLSQRPSCLRTCAKEKAINLDLIFVF